MAEPTPNRPWFQFSLRTMFVVVTISVLLLVIYRQQLRIMDLERVIKGQSVEIEIMEKELTEGTTAPKFNSLPNSP